MALIKIKGGAVGMSKADCGDCGQSSAVVTDEQALQWSKHHACPDGKEFDISISDMISLLAVGVVSQKQVFDYVFKNEVPSEYTGIYQEDFEPAPDSGFDVDDFDTSIVDQSDRVICEPVYLPPDGQDDCVNP